MSTLSCFWCPPCKAAAQPVMDTLPLLCTLSSPSAPGVFLCPNSLSSLPASPLCNCPLSQGLLCNQVTSGSHPHLTAPTSALACQVQSFTVGWAKPSRGMWGEGAGEREGGALLTPLGAGGASLAGRSSGGAGSAGEALAHGLLSGDSSRLSVPQLSPLQSEARDVVNATELYTLNLLRE